MDDLPDEIWAGCMAYSSQKWGTDNPDNKDNTPYVVKYIRADLARTAPASVDNVEALAALERVRTRKKYGLPSGGGGAFGIDCVTFTRAKDIETIRKALQQPQLDELREKVEGMRKAYDYPPTDPQGIRVVSTQNDKRQIENNIIDDVLALIGGKL